MSNSINMASYDEAFGLHFRGDHADPASSKIKKLDERVRVLESEVIELKDMLYQMSKKLSEYSDEKVNDRLDKKQQSFLDNVGGFFANLFYRTPTKILVEPDPSTKRYIDPIYEDPSVEVLKLPEPDAPRDFRKISQEEMKSKIEELNKEQDELYGSTTGKIPVNEFEDRLKKLTDLRERENAEFENQLTDTERFQSFAQFTKERNAEVNKVFIETEERRGF